MLLTHDLQPPQMPLEVLLATFQPGAQLIYLRFVALPEPPTNPKAADPLKDHVAEDYEQPTIVNNHGKESPEQAPRAPFHQLTNAQDCMERSTTMLPSTAERAHRG